MDTFLDLVTIIVVIAAIVVLNGFVFYLVWNTFVFHHVNGIAKTSIGGAILVAWGLTALFGAAVATVRFK